MLESQIVQQANSSTTPLGRLPSKSELNPREQCNAIVMRSGTQLEGPKGPSTWWGRKSKEHDKCVTSLPSENEPQEKGESERPKELKCEDPHVTTC